MPLNWQPGGAVLTQQLHKTSKQTDLKRLAHASGKICAVHKDWRPYAPLPKKLSVKDNRMSNSNSTLTADRLREMLIYDPSSGIFIWRLNRRRVRAGDVAGSVNHDGYVRIKVLGAQYFAHRLAWLYMMGEWPVDEIDHKDRKRANNQWSNLRETDHSGNMRNRVLVNSSECLGVSLRQNGRWQSRIRYQGVRRHLGTFDTQQDAIKAYMDARSTIRMCPSCVCWASKAGQRLPIP